MSQSTSAREAVLGKVRAALQVRAAPAHDDQGIPHVSTFAHGDGPPSSAAAGGNGAAAPGNGSPSALWPDRHTDPAAEQAQRPALSGGPLLDLFCERVADYRAEVVRCPSEEVPYAVARALGTATRVVVPDGFPPQWLPARLDPLRDSGLSVTELDRVEGVVTTIRVGIAETGTVVLDAGPGQGRRALTLLPDLHVCVVDADQVVPDVPEALQRLDPSRPLTWISGPSATSDIELSRVEGVHGPRNLHVVVVDASAGGTSGSGPGSGAAVPVPETETATEARGDLG